MQKEKETLNNDILEPSLVSKIFDALIQKLWLVILFVVLGVGFGFVYDNLREREYIVYHDVGFTAQNTAIFQALRAGEDFLVKNSNGEVMPSGVLSDGRYYYISDKNLRYVKVNNSFLQIDEIDGGYKIKENDTTHINTANKYIDTVVDFFKTGVVTDRANFYYNQFEFIYNQKVLDDPLLDKNIFLQEYIDAISKTKFSNEKLKQKVGQLFDVCLYKKDNKSEIVQLYFMGFDTATNNLKFADGDGNEQFLPRYQNANSPINSVLYVKYPDNYVEYVAGFTDQDLSLNQDKIFNLTLHKNKNDGSWERTILQNVKFIGIVDNKLKFKNGDEELLFSRYDGKIKYLPSGDENANSYIYSVDTASISETYDYFYERNSIVGSKVNVKYEIESENIINYNFSVGYQDKTPSLAQEKLMFVILATKQEVKSYAEGYDYSAIRNNAVDYRYFNIVSINVIDLGHHSTNVNISAKKLIVFFGAAGLLVSFLLIYVLSLFDTTITSRKDLERMAGVPVFAYIQDADEEDEKNG